MCIFSQPIDSVNNTKIFARTTATNTQFIVYQMNYKSVHSNAMILPIPIRRPTHDRSLRFIDLSHYDTFFDDLSKGFPYIGPSNMGCGAPDSVSTGKSALEVFEVGNYIGSFVPNLSDFSRLDDRFTLPSATWSKLPQYDDYGFVVFQLAEGSLKPHPMAFEFETNSDQIFFPTLHIHDGTIHATEEFDHTLYLQHAGFDSKVYGYENSDVADKSTGLIRSKFTAEHFCKVDKANGIVLSDLLVHRTLIRGNRENRDTQFPTSGDPAVPSLNLRPWFSFTPWLILFAAVSWFFVRRNRVKREKQTNQS